MHKIVVIAILILSIQGAFANSFNTLFNDGQKAFSAKEYSRAFEIWLPLAVDGIVNAQDTIGYLYSNGLGIEQNNKEAVKWYRKAADAGHLEAMFNLANAYRIGKGAEKNYKEAEFFYRKSICSGFVYSIVGLVALYTSGNLEVKSDEEKAALVNEKEKLGDPKYREWLIEKSKEKLDLNNGLQPTNLRVASVCG